MARRKSLKKTQAPSKPEKAPVAVQAPAPAPLPPIPQEVAKRYHAEADEGFQKLLAHFSPFEPAEVPDRVVDYVRGVFRATSEEEAAHIVKRALEKLEMHLLAQWAVNRVTGPMNSHTIQKLYEKQMSKADHLQRLGLSDEKIQAQIEKAKATLARMPKIKKEAA